MCFVALNPVTTTYQLAKSKGQRGTLCAMPLARSKLSRLACKIFLSSLQPSFSAICSRHLTRDRGRLFFPAEPKKFDELLSHRLFTAGEQIELRRVVGALQDGPPFGVFVHGEQDFFKTLGDWRR
jgi:hypothetical protein